jgi:hypothetical protein
MDTLSPDATTQTTTLSTGPVVMPPQREWLRPVLSLLVVLGFFAALAALMTIEVPASANSPLLVMLGTLIAAVQSVLGYYFSTTASSTRKTELLAQEKRQT